ncbi:hypothetical protein DERP_003578 [Dermatophagoides pteronyssinus]|uniref:Uncharacterized protein n=1 Tax=Dermatophagoides pteronyssinus TaxID=6956 RepID=A0ABQ8JLK1_DERPT|nr:hypothetical protein DERP_003578 [Dermatophagoides pteronyssinus]
MCSEHCTPYNVLNSANWSNFGHTTVVTYQILRRIYDEDLESVFGRLRNPKEMIAELEHKYRG